jgi:hypothetical protein
VTDTAEVAVKSALKMLTPLLAFVDIGRLSNTVPTTIIDKNDATSILDGGVLLRKFFPIAPPIIVLKHLLKN